MPQVDAATFAFALLAIGSSNAVVGSGGRLLATVMIHDREACAALQVIEWNVRADEAFFVVVRWLVVP